MVGVFQPRGQWGEVVGRLQDPDSLLDRPGLTLMQPVRMPSVSAQWKKQQMGGGGTWAVVGATGWSWVSRVKSISEGLLYPA